MLGFKRGHGNLHHRKCHNKNTIQIFNNETLEIKYINKINSIPIGYTKGNPNRKKKND